MDNNKNNEQMSNEDKKKVLYFTATWCGPCNKIKPTFKNLEPNFKNIEFVLVDIDKNRDMASYYSINSVPTFIFLKGDDETFRFSGANEDKLKTSLEAHDRL